MVEKSYPPNKHHHSGDITLPTVFRCRSISGTVGSIQRAWIDMHLVFEIAIDDIAHTHGLLVDIGLGVGVLLRLLEWWWGIMEQDMHTQHHNADALN